ncbi:MULTISPECIES: ExbD/TolR family protein [Alteromonadaceae]|uniref:ExbD/TolR family protein n=1 Tax=Alteromonadaceae TaxID=72275 RepID=UPI001C09C00F|nr:MULTISPECIES: biopolymer transporter ExbD [Aliiglaciecola]MBU2877237.1 biopolymer transporter ExbD [Aliiglaciecola lipolytica]MDO6712062.1 biopolymer transporter ExbD [Aliiglaciecola sp. 2_MG-2023]MDO6754371.1 biopolymer transporter ExbD [Aliiglaciecola sp. 1_MG-2023]
MLGRKKRLQKQDAELDITSFMNLMIVLVPVLLMMMVFSRITVLELTLPELGEASEQTDLDEEDKQLEIIVRHSGLEVFYPQGYLVKSIPNLDQEYDYEALQYVLKQIKQTLKNQELEKNQATLLLEHDIPYQVIVALMDTTRSYEDVVVASVVQAELFPQISLGDAPLEDVSNQSNQTP